MLNEKKILIYFLFCLSFVICSKLNKKTKHLFRCNPDKIEPMPIPLKYAKPLPKNLKDKRALDGDGFKDFKIYLDLENFNHEADEYKIDDNRKNIFIQGMQNAVATLEKLLRVKPLTQDYIIPNSEIIKYQINYWDHKLIGDGKSISQSGEDLFIFVRFGNNSELGPYTLASAGARFGETGTGRPIFGVANINRDIEYSLPNSLHYFQATILHEFIHILGFSNYFFVNYQKTNFTRKDNDGITRVFLNSQKLLEVARNYYNCSTLDGVELEEYGGDGTTGSHWEERILLGDIMNGVVYPEEQVISEFTLAVLEDTGYYKPNYYTGGLMQYGKNKGCEFLNSKCVIKGQVNDKFKNEFFEQIFYTQHYQVDPGCSSGRQSRAYHAFYDYKNFVTIPSYYQYYANPNLGGRPSADYCPVSQEDIGEAETSYYVGHCSTKGSGNFGSMIMHYGSNGDISSNINNGNLASITGEENSATSFCILSSLISKNIVNSAIHSNTVNALCYQIYCSDKSLTIKINNDFLVCPRSGGKINAFNYDGYLLCPDYYLICSGTTLCNDMFDCVEKESSLKPDIVYDYEIKTSQDIGDAENANFEEGFELATNGKCPENCKQCNEKGECIICRNDYGVVEFTEDEIIKRKCMEIANLKIGYYKNQNIYFKCLDNCDECTNSSECIKCNNLYIIKNGNCFPKIDNCEEYDDNGDCIECVDKSIVENNIGKKGTKGCTNYDEGQEKCLKCNDEEDYVLVNGLCYKKIQNCHEYGENELCLQCDLGYAFIENDRKHCFEKESIGEEYYSKDNEISYYKCDETGNEGIENCLKCEYASDDEGLKCIQCKNSYVLKDNETKKCYEKASYESNNKYYEFDENHIKSCSSLTNDCDECQKDSSSSSVKCTKCQDNFVLVNDMCYHEIINCQNYNTDEKCLKCKEEFAFEKDNRDNCKKISSYFQEYYTKDEGLSYYKCDERETGGIDNCKTCQYEGSELKCTQCKDEFLLEDEKTSECFPSSNYLNNNQFYYEDEYHVRSCSSALTNCVECERVEANGGTINCLECKNDYNIFFEDNSNCKQISEVTDIEEYYEEEGKYYLCSKHSSIENCKKCSDKNTCSLCKEDYAFLEEDKSECKSIESLGEHYIPKPDDPTSYNKCSNIMPNCDTCQSTTECKTCMRNFGLFNDKKTCINLDEQKYYKNEEDNLYYLCNTGVTNCEECSSKNECIKCADNYFKINNNKAICYSESEIDVTTKEYYKDPNDDNNYYKCSNYVEHCKYCDYPDGCSLCETEPGYIMLNENKKKCYLKSSITDLQDYYYTIDNGITYLSCKENKYKNDISCFTKIPEQKISLKFLQAQMIANHLHCFMITHSPLPKDFSLKLKLSKYTSSNRNLQSEPENEVEAILTTSEDSNGVDNKIIDFTSTTAYSENEDIKIKSIDFDSGSTTTNTVTSNNDCSLIFDGDSKLIDTGAVKTMIANNKIPDCSLTEQKSNIVTLNLDKIENCEFHLNSDETISLTKDTLDIDFVESKNGEKNIVAQCDTKIKTSNSIKCIINKDDNEEINNIYTFKDEILFDTNKYITLSSNKDKFKIYCEKKENTSKKQDIVTLAVSACVGAVVIAIIIATIIVCRKNKTGPEIPRNETVNGKEDQKMRKLERLATKDLKQRRKSVLQPNKLNTLNIIETEAVLNINENKRKKSRSKTKKKTVHHTRANKKHKSTKHTNKSEEE